MWRTITRSLVFSVAVALLAIAALGRSSAMPFVPRGSLVFTFIEGSDGGGGFGIGDPAPELYLSAEDGAFLGASTVLYPQESAVALDDGHVSNQANRYYKACSLDSVLHASVGGPNGAGTYGATTHDYTTYFWGAGNHSWGGTRLYNVNRDGTLGGYQSSTGFGTPVGNPGLGSVDPNLQIAYLSRGTDGVFGSAKVRIGRYDLANNVWLSDLATEATRIIRTPTEDHIRVLRDGTILVAWQSPSLGSGVTNVVKHYAADGTLLHTIPISTTDRPNQAMRITPDLTDSDTFWITHFEVDDPGGLNDTVAAYYSKYLVDGTLVHRITVTDADWDAINAQLAPLGGRWGDPADGFYLMPEDCMSYVIAEIRGAKKHGLTSDPRFTYFSLQAEGDDLVVKIPEAVQGAATKIVYRVFHGYSQRTQFPESRSKIEMRGQVSSHVDPTVAVPVSKPDAWVELRINGRVYANLDDYDLIDPNSLVTGCKNAVTGLNTHNQYGWSIGMWQNEFLDCCYLDTNAAYCRPPTSQGPPGTDPENDGELGPCPPPGPGGSSFDGAADGDRFVAPGGFPATYVPPTGQGTVATALDPVDHQDLSTLRSPLVSVDLTVCDGTTYRLAKSTLPRPGEPPCDARVLRFGGIPYPFSNRFGSLAPQTWQLEVADEDGLFRALLASGQNRFYKRWTADAFVEDNDARLRNETRQRVARGRCITVRTGDEDQTLVLVFSDEYSRHDSAFSLDRPLPIALIGDIFRGGSTSPDLSSVPHAADDVAAKAATLIGGEGSDEYRITEGITPIGIVPLQFVGQVNLGGAIWDAYFVNLLADYSIPALFGSNLDPDCPASVRLDPSLYDGTGVTQFLIPGYSPWDGYFSNKYIAITYGDKTYWVTMMFGQGPVSLQHVLQKVPLSANVNGIEATGDGTGALVDDAARLLVRLLDIILRGQTSGLWGPISAYDDGIAKIRTSDFEAIRLIHNARLSTRYRGAVIIDSQRAARDWLGDILVSFDIRLLLNHHGQIGAAILDDQSSLANLTTFTDLHHILDRTFKITSELSAELENGLTYDAGPEPASGRLTVGKGTVRGEQSIQDWGEGEEYLAQPQTFVALHRADVAGNVAAHRIAWTQNGITRGEYQIDLAGGALRGGQLVRVTHHAGIGQTGWRRRVLMLTDRVLLIDDEEFRSRVEWEDAHPILVKTLSGDEILHHDPDAGEDEPRVGFKPIGSEVAGTGWTIGSEAAGTAYRAG